MSLRKVNLGPVEQIPEASSKGFVAGTVSLFAVRRNTRIHVYRNQCPHLGIELEWMPDRFLDSQGTFIQCSTHGALFLIDTGECITGPCLGRHLQPIAADIIDGELWVQLPE